MSNIVNLEGKKFGRLFVIKRNGVNKTGQAMWLCQCDCGNFTIIRGTDLRNGKTLSCGCFHRDIVSKEKGVATFNRMYYGYKRKAEQKELKFELTKNEFENIIKENCFYCGTVPKYRYKRKNDRLIANGIDRINNNDGYTIDNIVPCCPDCNYAKRKMSQEDFKSWVERVYKNFCYKGEN